MFPLAILIGVYSYLLFVLGISHLLYPIAVYLITTLWLIGVVLWFKNDIIKCNKIILGIKSNLNTLSAFSKLLGILLGVMWSVNLFGVFAPERAFDALWYHLTLPKIFIENHAVLYIPGGLFYYSLMPKLVDLLFIPPLMIGSTVAAKLVHFTFGILTLIVIYKISRYFLPFATSLLVLVAFSSNLVVAWESTTAYIDLGRTFFEVMAFYGVILFITTKKKLWLTESAIMLGFAISTKLLAVASLPIFLGVLMYVFRNKVKEGFRESVKFSLTAIAVPMPYFVFSFINTGNPVYPFFTNIYKTEIERNLLSFNKLILDFWTVFVRGDDPVNPIYLIVLPLLFLIYKKLRSIEKLVIIYSLLSLLIWYITPRTGGGRFLLPYLPVLSLMVGVILVNLKGTQIRRAIVLVILFLAVAAVGYRVVASYRYIPVIVGNETEQKFLTRNLNFQFGDFYDTDGYFAKTMSSKDTVLIYGIHNLYYAEFPFIHESYAKPGDEFNYILSPTTMRLPERFYAWKPIYSNSTTGVTIYSQEGTTWVY